MTAAYNKQGTKTDTKAHACDLSTQTGGLPQAQGHVGFVVNSKTVWTANWYPVSENKTKQQQQQHSGFNLQTLIHSSLALARHSPSDLAELWLECPFTLPRGLRNCGSPQSVLKEEINEQAEELQGKKKKKTNVIYEEPMTSRMFLLQDSAGLRAFCPLRDCWVQFPDLGCESMQLKDTSS